MYSVLLRHSITGFNYHGKDHYETLDKVIWICRQADLNLNKDKCLFRCTSIPFFGKLIWWQGRSLDPRKVQALTEMLLPKYKKELQSFMGILSYLFEFSPATAGVCEPLWKLTSVKADWTLNIMYQDLYDREKKIVKKDAWMKFYNASRPLYIEIDASGVCREAILLQVKDGVNCRCDEVPDNTAVGPSAFTNKSLASAEHCYSNKGCDVPGILHDCFAREVCIITDHKQFVAIISKARMWPCCPSDYSLLCCACTSTGYT